MALCSVSVLSKLCISYSSIYRAACEGGCLCMKEMLVHIVFLVIKTVYQFSHFVCDCLLLMKNMCISSFESFLYQLLVGYQTGLCINLDCVLPVTCTTCLQRYMCFVHVHQFECVTT